MNGYAWFIIGCLALLPAGSAAAEPGTVPEVRSGTGGAADVPLTLEVPLFSKRFSSFPVAVVNDDPITLDELVGNLASMHDGRSDAATGARKDFRHMLDRLINTRLIVLEARTMGMDELPEVTGLVNDHRRATLIRLVQKRAVKDIAADERQVEQLYRELVRTYTMRSLMFKEEQQARAFSAAVNGGGEYDARAQEALASGAARGAGEAETLRASDLMPSVKEAVAAMQPGDTSRPIAIGPGFVVFRLDDLTESDRPEARDEARRRVLAAAQGEALVANNRALRTRYLSFEKKRIDALVLDPKKMDAHLKDKRVLARVKGEEPVTVADVARVIEEKLYHGSGTSTKNKINRRKLDALEEVLARRVLLAEAKRLDLEQSDEFQREMREYEGSVLFGLFVERVVRPSVKLKHEEVQAYYDAHRGEYLQQPRFLLDGIAFADRAAAEQALNSLARGTDLTWLRQNGPGRAEPSAEGLFAFPDRDVPLSELPESFRAELEGARPGDRRVADGGTGLAYVLIVRDVREPEPQPLDQVKGEIERAVYRDRMEAAINGWADRVRPSYDVQVFLRGGEADAQPADPTTSLVRKSDDDH